MELFINTDYGELYLDINPILEDCSFTAYNFMGMLQKYGGREIVGFEVNTALLGDIDCISNWENFISNNELMDIIIEGYNYE